MSPTRLAAIAALLLVTLPPPASPHGGGLDAHGCHHGGTEGYHCHRPPLATPEKPHDADPHPLWRTVTRVIDGDTIVLDHDEHVRLIGVDCPEMAPRRGGATRFGKEAAAFVRDLVAAGPVRLEYDRNRRDLYGRTLAYVYRADGLLVNEEIIRRGYGYLLAKYPFAEPMMDRFRSAEREARGGGRGLWAR